MAPNPRKRSRGVKGKAKPASHDLFVTATILLIVLSAGVLHKAHFKTLFHRYETRRSLWLCSVPSWGCFSPCGLPAPAVESTRSWTPVENADSLASAELKFLPWHQGLCISRKHLRDSLGAWEFENHRFLMWEHLTKYRNKPSCSVELFFLCDDLLQKLMSFLVYMEFLEE